MAEKRTTNTNVTRYDKAHKKFMDKLNVLKDNVNHGYDSLKVVHKQTVDSSVNFKETVDKGQEQERKDDSLPEASQLHSIYFKTPRQNLCGKADDPLQKGYL